MIVTFSEFTDALEEYTKSKSIGKENIANIVSTIVDSLIQLVKAIFNAIVNIFSKIKKVILYHLTTASINAKILKKDPKNPIYEEKLKEVTATYIDYKSLVDYIYTFSTVNQDIVSSINLTDLNQQIDTYINLSPDDTGTYLKPTKYPLTEQFFTTKLKDNLEKLGIIASPTNSEISNQDVIITKFDITTIEKLKGPEKTLKDLGYTTEGLINTIDNGYKQLQYSIQNIEIYKNFFSKIQTKLTNYKTKNSQVQQESLNDPNHKLNRLRLLLENITVYLSLYGRLIVTNSKIVSIISNISTVLVN